MRPLFFLFKSEKKTDEGHLKEMSEVLRNIFLFLFGLMDSSFWFEIISFG